LIAPTWTAKTLHCSCPLLGEVRVSSTSRHKAVHRAERTKKFLSMEPLAKLQWCDEFSTGMSGKRGVRGVLG